MKRFGIFEKLYNRVEDEEELAPGSEEETQEETEEQEEDDETEEEDEEEETPQVDPDAAKAIEIYKALSNPETAPGMMAFLNAQLAAKGLAPATKADIASISLSDILKEGFGEEYAFLHEKMSPALEKAINAAIEGKIGSRFQQLEESNSSLRNEIAATKISAVLDPIIEEMGAAEFDKIAPALEKTMQRYPNNTGLPMKTYIKDMLNLTKQAKNAPERTEKIRKNVREARRNSPNGVDAKTVKIGSRTPSIRESVEAAMRGETFED